MKTEKEVTKMLELFKGITQGYTTHAIQAILKLILELDADEDITYLKQLNVDSEIVQRFEVQK